MGAVARMRKWFMLPNGVGGTDRKPNGGASSCLPRLEDSGLPYMGQLDGLRGIALFGPLIAHWCSPDNVIRKHLPLFDALTLFFVLSGFLITRILLGCRHKSEAEPDARGRLAWHFFIRRGLRIFPVYYATLLVTVLGAIPGMIDQLSWNLAYLSNVYYLLHPDLSLGSHFWSLSVEEQFYIVWALSILFLSRQMFKRLLLVLIALAPVVRIVARSWNLSYLELIPLAYFDSFGLGALLGLSNDPRSSVGEARPLLTRAGLWVGLPAYSFVLLAYSAGHVLGVSYSDVYPLHRFVASLFFVWLVDSAARGFSGPVGRFLESPVLIYLGTISYGIYVMHPFTAPFMRMAIDHFGLSKALLESTHWFSVKFAGTVVVATLSWFLLEKPMQRLKRFFPYR